MLLLGKTQTARVKQHVSSEHITGVIQGEEEPGASKMAPEVQELAAETDDLSSVLGTHVRKKRTDFQSCTLTSKYRLRTSYAHTHINKQTSKRTNKSVKGLANAKVASGTVKAS